ncbi:MAG TPA: ribonuclease Z [Solirubrobacteraceae bacterium]|nr:ribonuclease Z [Solirubrobacteraceae bacterium]
MDLSVFFAGTAGSVPSARRGLPAVLVRRGGDRLLFDCGEGTQRQLLRSVGLLDMDSVFITHFHADHWLGLPGMLKSFALRERGEPLSVYGPPGVKELMGAMRVIYGRLPYELSIVELAPTQTVERDGYLIAAIPVRHKGDASFGYALVEEPRPGHLDPRLAEQLGVTPGPDFGRLQRGETVAGVRPEQVMGPTREGRKLVLSGDTVPCEALAIAAHQADVLVHEATFLQEDAERARQTLHSTARQAAQLARDAEVRLLALTHVSGRYAGGELRDEARAVFAASEAVRDFDTIDVPFPERGPATLVRWPERVARERAQASAQEQRATSERGEANGGEGEEAGPLAPPPPPPPASSPNPEPVASP